MQATIKAAQPKVGTQLGDGFDLKAIAVVAAPGGAVSKRSKALISKRSKALLSLVFTRTSKERLLRRWLDKLQVAYTPEDAANIYRLCQRMMLHAHGKTAWQLLYVMRKTKYVTDEEEWMDYVEAEMTACWTARKSELWEDEEDEEDEDELTYKADLEMIAYYLAERDPWNAFWFCEHAVEVAPTEEQRQYALKLRKETEAECLVMESAEDQLE